MKKYLTSGVISAILLLFFTAPSNAITIGFNPQHQTVPVGDKAEVALVISELGNGAEPSIGAFDLDITFDPTILTFDSVVFGDPDLGDQLDLSGWGSWTAFIPGAASVNLYEVSIDPAAVLDSLQADSFTLAYLTFDTLSVGTSSLGIRVLVLSDAWGDPLQATTDDGSISPVPEPATFFLLSAGLVGLAGLRRKKR